MYNRTASKADDLVKEGATYVKDPRELASKVDVLLMMVGYPKDLKQMTLNKDTGLLQHMKPGSYFIDHTTSTASLA